jgi:hypothetical protein
VKQEEQELKDPRLRLYDYSRLPDIEFPLVDLDVQEPENTLLRLDHNFITRK